MTLAAALTHAPLAPTLAMVFVMTERAHSSRLSVAAHAWWMERFGRVRRLPRRRKRK